MKLRGRTEAPTKRRGRTLSSRPRGANQTTPHGSLQRLLEVMLPPTKCYLTGFQCGLVRVVHWAGKARVYQY